MNSLLLRQHPAKKATSIDVEKNLVIVDVEKNLFVVLRGTLLLRILDPRARHHV